MRTSTRFPGLVCAVWLAALSALLAQNPAPPLVDATQPHSAAGQDGRIAPNSPPPARGRDGLVELPPTPMLDEEGRQRLDPSGKPMFNPPVRQQRDKKGRPVFDENGRPVMQTPDEMGFDEHGKKIQGLKEKGPRTVSMNVVRGILTVDGLPARAALNYEITGLKYIYFYAPFVGTAVVSNEPFPGAMEQKDAFEDHTLTVNVGDHVFQLYSDERLLSKKPEPAYVLVDRDFRLATKGPSVGFGTTSKAPYVWPGSKESAVARGESGAPPLPANLRPVGLLPPCPQGQVRVPQPAGKEGMQEVCAPAAVAAPRPQ